MNCSLRDMNLPDTIAGETILHSGNRIVVLVDFLEEDDTFVESVCNEAGKSSAQVHFIHVFDFCKDDPMLENIYVERCEKRLQENARADMNHLLERARRLHPHCTGEVISGEKSDI